MSFSVNPLLVGSYLLWQTKLSHFKRTNSEVYLPYGVDFPTSLLSHRSLCSLTSRPIVRAPGAPGSFANFNGTGLLTKTFRRVGSNFNIIKNGRFLIVLLSWSLEIQIAMEDGRNILFNPFVGHLRVVVS